MWLISHSFSGWSHSAFPFHPRQNGSVDGAYIQSSQAWFVTSEAGPRREGGMNEFSRRWRGQGGGRRKVSHAPHSLLPIQGLYEPFMTCWRVEKWKFQPAPPHPEPVSLQQSQGALSCCHWLSRGNMALKSRPLHLLNPERAPLPSLGKPSSTSQKPASSAILSSLRETPPPHWQRVPTLPSCRHQHRAYWGLHDEPGVPL